jgi:hypothetical protein
LSTGGAKTSNNSLPPSVAQSNQMVLNWLQVS